MFHLNYLLCSVVLINFILFQSVVGGYEQTSGICNDYKLANGRMRIKRLGRLAKFQCNRGYMLAGEKYSYCIKGKFDVPPPVCVKPTCTKIKQLTNGMILPSHNGGVVNFYCKPGFTMRGANITYCDGRKWSHNLPACISTHMSTPLSCDFETEDLCGWSHDLNHDFDWRRHNSQTPSGHIGTGPKNDHTKGQNQDGYYMYIESTSRLENDVARLISPLYSRQPDGMCFTFWYHMFGRDMGQLRVYLQEAGSYRRMKPLWTEQGNQGDVWHKGKVILQEGVNEDFQIIIEGVRGKSYVSDMAIDDVVLSESCSDDDDTNNSSTTESSTDEESDIYFGSCINKCNDNNTDIIMSDAGSCECNDSCYERNTCCPDYTIVCLIASFDDLSTDVTESYSTTEMEETEKYLSTTFVTNTPKEHFKTTEQQTTSPKPTTIPSRTTLKPIILTNNTKINTTTMKSINRNNNTRKTTEMNNILTSTPMPSSGTVTTKLTTTNRPKIITTKPTKPTPKIDKNNNNIDKIITVLPKITTVLTKTTTISPKITTISPKTTTISPKTTTISLKTTSIKSITKNNKTNKTIKPFLPKIEITSTSSTIKPTAIKNLVTTKFPVVEPEPEPEEPVKSQTLTIETDYEPTKSVSIEPKTQMVMLNEKIVNEQSDSNLTLVIFCTSGVLVIGVIVSVVIFVKYNTRCSRLKFRNSRNSDSMSDVRFLASDEVLDFTWRTSNDM